MDSIIQIVMLVLTILFSLYIFICTLRGLFKGWKWSLIILCRIFLAAVLAFIATKVLASITVVNELLTELIEDNLDFDAGIIVEMARSIANTLILPFVFYMLFCLFNLILMIPAHFVKKAVLSPKRKKNIDKHVKVEAAPVVTAPVEPAPAEIAPVESIAPSVSEGSLTNEAEAPAEAVVATDAENSADTIGDVVAEQTVVATATTEPADNIPVEVKPDEKSSAEKAKKPKKSDEEIARSRDRRQKVFNRLGGAGIRACAAALSVSIFLFPVMSLFFTFADGVILIANTANEIDPEINVGDSIDILDYNLTDRHGNLDFAEIDDMIDHVFDPIYGNIYLSMSYSAPMRFAHAVMAAVPGSNVFAGNEIAQAFALVANAIYLVVELGDYGDDQIEAITHISNYISESEFHSNIVAELISAAAENMLDEGDLSEDEETAMLIIPLLEELEDVTSKTIADDVRTLGSIITTMIDYEIFSDISKGGDLIESFSDEDFLYDILSAINENDDFRSMIPSLISMSVSSLTEELGSAGDKINLDSDIDELSAKELRREAEIISVLLKDVNTISTAMSGDSYSNSEMTDEVRALGKTLDTAIDSLLIGGAVKDLFVSILDSDMFGEESAEIARVVKNHIDEDISIENLIVAIQKFTVILENYKSSGANDNTVLANSMRELSSSLDGTTAVIIKEIINETDIFDSSSGEGEGTSDTSTDAMKTVMNVFVDKLAAGEISDDEYEKEAKALDYTMQIVDTASSGGVDGIKHIYGDADGMDEMVSTIVTAKITSTSVSEIAYDDEGNLTNDALEISSGVDDEDRAQLIKSCKNTYITEASQPDADVALLETNLKAIASIFGEDITDDIVDWRNEVK